MVYVSLGLRAIVNVEALNMVESVGNVTRHRKASIVYKSGDKYVLRSVPVVSGESIAHAYQWWIAELSKKKGLSLCQYCEQREFLKHSDREFFGNKSWEQALVLPLKKFDKYKDEYKKEKKTKKLSLDDFIKYLTNKYPSYAKDLEKIVPQVYNIIEDERRKGEYKLVYNPHAIEKIIVMNCVVEDIGGFLYPGERPIKRTSRFQVGYMIPAFDAIEKSSLEPQFHVRHSPSLIAQRGARIQPQMIYYVEVGSAVYTLSFNIDIDGIGYTSMIKIESAVGDEERAKRIDVALDALALMLDNKVFGAKLTRFNPVIDYESILVSVSEGCIFNISPPASKDYIKDTVIRAEKYEKVFGSKIALLGYKTDHEKVKDFNTIVELFNEVKNLVKGAKK
ncbi:MAG: hypothetical protein DRO18_02595 [Thermoprotei archaeon]|nr:MAG: hypothetical protein DRO18_02595 [Thermoprotei archaeon]